MEHKGARLVEPIQLRKWKIRVYVPGSTLVIGSNPVKVVRTNSNRFVASPNVLSIVPYVMCLLTLLLLLLLSHLMSADGAREDPK